VAVEYWIKIMIYYTYIFHYFYNIYVYQQQLVGFYGFCMKALEAILIEGDFTSLIIYSSFLVSIGFLFIIYLLKIIFVISLNAY
jgi:hypothetical protein